MNNTGEDSDCLEKGRSPVGGESREGGYTPPLWDHGLLCKPSDQWYWVYKVRGY